NTVPFKTMQMLLGEAASIDLKLLPDSPDLIPEHITEFLPFALPISDRKQTRAVVAALRKIFFFTQLPSSYFYANKEPLPLDPSDLIDTFKGQFPITNYNSLSHLSELRASLKKYYHFTYIPPLYFDLPLFPLDPMLSSRDFLDMVGMLREKYEFRRLPNNYILARPFILNNPAKIKTDLIYIYPITDKQLAITFQTEIKYRYKFRLPRLYNNQAGPTPEVGELTSYIKDNIPDIATQVPITDYDTASQTIRAIQDHFNFTLIPNYLIDLPDLSTLEWGIFNDEPNHV
ncbi:41128_t:CDS:2, partial [Gigaspora margarita]